MARREPPHRAEFGIMCPNCGEGGRVYEGTWRLGYAEDIVDGRCKRCDECGHVWDITCQHCEESAEPPQEEGGA